MEAGALVRGSIGKRSVLAYDLSSRELIVKSSHLENNKVTWDINHAVPHGPFAEGGHMPARSDDLKDHLSRSSEITITVIGNDVRVLVTGENTLVDWFADVEVTLFKA